MFSSFIIPDFCPGISPLKRKGTIIKMNSAEFYFAVNFQITKKCLAILIENFRSSRPKMFCKKGVLKNFAKFTGKHLCQSLFFNKVVGLRPFFQNTSGGSFCNFVESLKVKLFQVNVPFLYLLKTENLK